MTTKNREAIRASSLRMRTFVGVLWVSCALLVVLERFSAATIRVFASGGAGDAWRHLLCQASAAVPEALFLLALWWTGSALRAFAEGAPFAAPVTRMLERVGVALACGAAIRILLVPGACRLLGENPGYWIAVDAASLVLAAIGLALRAIAGVLRHAAAIESELDEIF